MKTIASPAILPVVLALAGACAGCLAIKTEHEVKPIQITMDVNLKVDKALDEAIEHEQRQKPAYFDELNRLRESGKVGFDRNGSLVPRLELTDAESDVLEEASAAWTTRLAEIAKKEGKSIAEVRRGFADKMFARMPAGSWYQDESGAWVQKK